MPSSKHIVAATDFSETSGQALDVARDLAASLGAQVHLVHVIPDPARLPWSIDTGIAFMELEQQWRHHAASALTRARDAAGLPPDTTITIRCGDAAQEILGAADDARAALIVMGTHGHGPVARLVMGSVADKVLRHTTRPVLIVPPGAEL